MNHLNYEFDASEGDVAEATLDRAANVLLMDSASYEEYNQRSDKQLEYRGFPTMPQVVYWKKLTEIDPRKALSINLLWHHGFRLVSSRLSGH